MAKTVTFNDKNTVHRDSIETSDIKENSEAISSQDKLKINLSLEDLNILQKWIPDAQIFPFLRAKFLQQDSQGQAVLDETAMEQFIIQLDSKLKDITPTQTKLMHSLFYQPYDAAQVYTALTTWDHTAIQRQLGTSEMTQNQHTLMKELVRSRPLEEVYTALTTWDHTAIQRQLGTSEMTQNQHTLMKELVRSRPLEEVCTALTTWDHAWIQDQLETVDKKKIIPRVKEALSIQHLKHALTLEDDGAFSLSKKYFRIHQLKTFALKQFKIFRMIGLCVCIASIISVTIALSYPSPDPVLILIATLGLSLGTMIATGIKLSHRCIYDHSDQIKAEEERNTIHFFFNRNTAKSGFVMVGLSTVLTSVYALSGFTLIDAHLFLSKGIEAMVPASTAALITPLLTAFSILFVIIAIILISDWIMGRSLQETLPEHSELSDNTQDYSSEPYRQLIIFNKLNAACIVDDMQAIETWLPHFQGDAQQKEGLIQQAKTFGHREVATTIASDQSHTDSRRKIEILEQLAQIKSQTLPEKKIDEYVRSSIQAKLGDPKITGVEFKQTPHPEIRTVQTGHDQSYTLSLTRQYSLCDPFTGKTAYFNIQCSMKVKLGENGTNIVQNQQLMVDPEDQLNQYIKSASEIQKIYLTEMSKSLSINSSNNRAPTTTAQLKIEKTTSSPSGNPKENRIENRPRSHSCP